MTVSRSRLLFSHYRDKLSSPRLSCPRIYPEFFFRSPSGASRGGATATANPANRFYANISLFLLPLSIHAAQDTPATRLMRFDRVVREGERLFPISHPCATNTASLTHAPEEFR